MKLHTKYKGTLGEIAVAQALMRRGLPVFMELGNNNSPIDIITVKKGVLIRIQVKATEPVEGVLKVRAACVRDRKHVVYKPNDFDIIAVYDAQWDKVYYVPLAEVLKYKFARMNLRIAPTKNGMVRIHAADEYKSLNKAVKYLTAENKDDLYKMPPLKNKGRPDRRVPPEERVRRLITKEIALKMFSLKQKGFNNNQIADKLGFHASTVKRALAKFKLDKFKVVKSA